MEYTLLKLDHDKKKVYCNLKAKEILDVLQLEEMKSPRLDYSLFSAILELAMIFLIRFSFTKYIRQKLTAFLRLSSSTTETAWRPEYASYMVEGKYNV